MNTHQQFLESVNKIITLDPNSQGNKTQIYEANLKSWVCCQKAIECVVQEQNAYPAMDYKEISSARRNMKNLTEICSHSVHLKHLTKLHKVSRKSAYLFSYIIY